MLTGTGNDYACGVRGGPPRMRTCNAGELYILDLGPAYRGYFADNARTFAVDGRPTDEQLEAGDVIAVEPAIYDPALRCGMRIENNYLVTEAGLELLSPFPLDLALA
jgi:Xaa-Pro aminopeptidase